MNRGSTDPQADLDFMFSLIPESLLNLLLASEHTETIMTVNVGMDMLPLNRDTAVAYFWEMKSWRNWSII
jgi:hypothetical protein